jgi:toxin ParE1/3/4
MLPLVWTDEARADLREILSFIGDRNPTAGDRLADRIGEIVERLPKFPHIYRLGRLRGTREAVVHPNYILVYRVGDVIEIVSILHARQRYP